jgi:hypothetical protein
MCGKSRLEFYLKLKRLGYIFNKYHGTIAMNCRVVLKHYIVLKLYKIGCSIATIEFDVHKIIKKKKKPIMISIVEFFNSEIPY